MSDAAGFRQVLHEWARRQLEERSPHVGPFEILGVQMDYDPGFGGSDVTAPDPEITDIRIRFSHSGGACKLPDYLGGSPCRDTSWSPMESKTTVTMLNELLAIGDER